MSASTTTTVTSRARVSRGYRVLTERLEAPCDAAGLAAFRVMFGVLMVLAVVRFASLGWIRELYAAPSFHFTYLGFDWVRPWPLWGLYLHFASMAVSAAALAVGFHTRLSAGVFFVLFGYAELLDKSAYLNHYYLVTLLGFLLVLVPAGAAWSLDARRRRAERRVPRWTYWIFRAQLCLVYFYAGAAKLNPDWLWHGEPLRLWLGTFTDLPLLGPLFEQGWFALGMSWAGALYDLCVAPLLIWRKTRAFAFAFAVAFHVSVWLLFPIGIFPWVMLIGATLFFEPEWPRRWLARFNRRLGAASVASVRTATPRALWLIACVHLVVQLLVPLRFLLYPGWVNWSEEGFRFAWRVMLVEKAGQVEFEVVAPTARKRFQVFPRRELTPLQYRMMATQPDMIHEYALHLKRRYGERGYPDVKVYARAWVSLNGRPSEPLIDSDIDLASEPRSLGPSRFIVPLARPALF